MTRADRIRTRRGRLKVGGILLGLICAMPPCRAATELEADPFAYLSRGYSLHLAQTVGSDDRVQLGVFALDVPAFALDDHAFSVRYIHGVTLKFDHFAEGRLRGFFYGLDMNDSTARYRLDATGHTVYRNEFSIGPRIGYRFELGEHFYVTPWISADYLTRPEDITLDGRQYHEPRLSLFPTVHLGWRFGP